jgi:hypothetical protein
MAGDTKKWRATGLCEADPIMFPDFPYPHGVMTNFEEQNLYGKYARDAMRDAFVRQIEQWCDQNGITEAKLPGRGVWTTTVMFADKGDAMLFYLAHA